jgi:hypothetical protein
LSASKNSPSLPAGCSSSLGIECQAVPFRWRPLGTIARRCARVGNGKWALGQTASDSEVRQIAERCGEAYRKYSSLSLTISKADDRLIENTAGETNTSRPRPWIRCPRMYSSSGRDIGRGVAHVGWLAGLSSTFASYHPRGITFTEHDTCLREVCTVCILRRATEILMADTSNRRRSVKPGSRRRST